MNVINGTGRFSGISQIKQGGRIKEITAANGNVSGSVSVFKNSSTSGIIAFLPKIDYATGNLTRSVITGDINGDGKPDIIAGNYNANTLSILKNLANDVALPLILMNFSGKQADRQIKLEWSTEKEQNTDYFSVEHAYDGIRFSWIGDVAAAGNSTTQKNYEMIHTDPENGLNYYRLKMTDKDGRFTFSPVVQVYLDSKQKELLVYPNPARDYIMVEHPGSSINTQIRILDLTGKIVLTVKASKNTDKTRVYIRNLMPGVYKVVWSTDIHKSDQTLVVE